MICGSGNNIKARRQPFAERLVGTRLVALALQLLVVACLTPSSASASTLYRWNDVNGNPVMSDRPPPVGTTYTTINSSRYGGTSKSSPTAQTSQIGEQTRVTSRSVAPSEVAKKDPALCSQAKDSIFKLETFARIRTTDDDGTVRFLSDAEREDRLQRAQNIASAYCED